MKTMFKKLKGVSIAQWIAIFIFVSMGISMVFITIQIFLAPIEQTPGEPKVTLRSDYIFLLFECVLGVIILLLPTILSHRFKFEIPGLVYILFLVFFIRIYLLRNCPKILFHSSALG
ncbi:hypothetical protein PROCOU_10106 [Listeria rocourtiae FSL F6-920]|nr:hypothetical protein PROCOU_10106 [Listeria rocourtiae FSL F6-920]